MLFAVTKIECENLCGVLINHELCLECVPLLLAGIVVFLLVFTIFSLFF